MLPAVHRVGVLLCMGKVLIAFSPTNNLFAGLTQSGYPQLTIIHVTKNESSWLRIPLNHLCNIIIALLLLIILF